MVFNLNFIVSNRTYCQKTSVTNILRIESSMIVRKKQLQYKIFNTVITITNLKQVLTLTLANVQKMSPPTTFFLTLLCISCVSRTVLQVKFK